MSALDDSIAHFGEAIDDRAIIGSTLKQNNHERRLRYERELAAARARHERRMAIRRANAARLQPYIDAGPKYHFGDDGGEFNNERARESYAQGFSVGVAATTSGPGAAAMSPADERNRGANNRRAVAAPV